MKLSIITFPARFLLLLLVVAISVPVLFAETGSESVKLPYYRMWQGYSLEKFTPAEFVKTLSEKFVPETASITPRFGMQNYIVALPPASYSHDFPHEIALLQYTSEEDYLKTFTEEAGRNYAESHWDVFVRKGSKSLVARPFSSSRPEYFPVGFTYDVIEKPVDWQSGFTIFYLGKRLSQVPPKEFMEKMHAHVAAARSVFASEGLLGYIAVIKPEYEIAFMNWKDEETMNKCLSTDGGKKITDEAGSLLQMIMWEPLQKFSGKLEQGKAYLVK